MCQICELVKSEATQLEQENIEILTGSYEENPTNCKSCGNELWLDGITDKIDLCHACYIKLNTKEKN